jgi:XapX domain-containing protein
MKPYLLALGAGLLVGIIYALLNVRSPAPPVVALVGLLGILVGEQIPPLAKRVFEGGAITVSALREHCRNHVFGALPTRDADGPQTAAIKAPGPENGS